MASAPLIEKLKKVRLRQVVYPAVLAAYFLGVTAFFVFTARFLGETVNDVLDVTEATVEAEILRVDVANFNRVAKKLGIVVQLKAEPVPEAQAPAPVSEDRSALKIAVLNSTGVAGLAGGMRDILAGAGFTVGRIGNQSPAEATTLVKVKVEKQGSTFVEEIFELVSGKYRGATAAVLEEESDEDVVIVIGSR